MDFSLGQVLVHIFGASDPEVLELDTTCAKRGVKTERGASERKVGCEVGDLCGDTVM